MDRIPLDLGRVALAKAGRDEGGRFVVIKVVNEDYRLISDGDTRRTDHPKLKKKKHLRATPFKMDMPEGAMPTDAEIRRFLAGTTKKEG